MEKLTNELLGLANDVIYKEVAGSVSIGIGFGDVNLVAHAGDTSKNPHVQTCNETIYDIASLSKMIGTALSYALWVSKKPHLLNENPFSWWPSMTIYSLLNHTSGLKAHEKFYNIAGLGQKFSDNKELILKEIYKQNLNENLKSVYSDLGYIALGDYLEKRQSKPLFEIFKESFNNFNIKNNVCYFPSNMIQDSQLPFVAETGVCEKRKIRVRGQVNDLNCFYMGGIAGHAGLFSDLPSLMNIGKFFLKCIKTPSNREERAINYFMHHGLGFFRPDKYKSASDFSRQSCGHYGFTGTSMWIDPRLSKDGACVIILTNRVNQSRISYGIYRLRKKVHRLVVSHLASPHSF